MKREVKAPNPHPSGARPPEIPADKVPKHVEIQHQGTEQKFKLALKWDAAGIAETEWKIPREAKLGKLLLVASNEQRDGLIHVQQDAKLYVTVLENEQHQQPRSAPATTSRITGDCAAMAPQRR